MFDKLYLMFGPDPFDGLRDGAVICVCFQATRTAMVGGLSRKFSL